MCIRDSSIRRPSRLRFRDLSKCLHETWLFKQQTALRILHRNSVPLRVLVPRDREGERVLRMRRLVQRMIWPGLAEHAHLRARCSTMDYLRFQAVNEEPSAVTLVLLLVQTPTSLISNSVLVETFRCSTPGFSNPVSYTHLTLPTKRIV